MPATYRRSRRRIIQGSLALAGFGLLAGCGYVPLAAPRPARVARIGYVVLSAFVPELVDPFRQGMAELGFHEGRDYALEVRNAEGNVERLGELMTEVAALPLDLILTGSNQTVAAARRATGTLPIVMALSSNAVEAGYVASLARPGGNVTGLTVQEAELTKKSLELLKEAVPGATRVAVLWSPANPFHPTLLKSLEAGIRSSGTIIGR